MYKNLREYLDLLEKRGELARVAVPADPVGEISEIADRIVKNGGKALLFENTGTDFPVAINLFGSRERMAAALGVDSLDDIPGRIEELIKKVLSPKSGLSDKMRILPVLGEAARWFPRNVSGRGECQQVVLEGEAAKLSLLPILKCWPHDGGRFITLPLVNTIDPDTGIRNVGMYRMQVLDDHTTGMHWHMHKTGAKHYEQYRQRGERMPVSVCVGGDPAYTYSAVAPVPEGIDEYLLAGFLRGKPVKLVKCLTNDLRVPADCDFVIEGYVDPAGEKVIEGPFGDHTGFYSLEDYYPKFHITAITHRRDAVYPATIVGIPPQEDMYIAEATEKIFLAPIRLVMNPELEDLYMPGAGVAHNIAIVNIRTSYPGQAAKIASSLWGAGQMMFTKYMLIVSTDKDIRDPEVLAGLLRAADIPSAVIRTTGILDILDHATATPGVGGKLALDLTCVGKGSYGCESERGGLCGAGSGDAANENAGAGDSGSDGKPVLPSAISYTGNVLSCDASLVGKWGVLVLRSEPGKQVDVTGFIKANGFGSVKYAVVFDVRTGGLSPEELLWLSATNTDPGRDVSLHGGILVIDARTKLPGGPGNPSRFPNVVTSSPAIRELVDRRWAEYGLGEHVESPSGHYEGLVMSDKAEI